MDTELTYFIAAKSIGVASFKVCYPVLVKKEVPPINQRDPILIGILSGVDPWIEIDL